MNKNKIDIENNVERICSKIDDLDLRLLNLAHKVDVININMKWFACAVLVYLTALILLVHFIK